VPLLRIINLEKYRQKKTISGSMAIPYGNIARRIVLSLLRCTNFTEIYKIKNRLKFSTEINVVCLPEKLGLVIFAYS